MLSYEHVLGKIKSFSVPKQVIIMLLSHYYHVIIMLSCYYHVIIAHIQADADAEHANHTDVADQVQQLLSLQPSVSSCDTRIQSSLDVFGRRAPPAPPWGGDQGATGRGHFRQTGEAIRVGLKPCPWQAGCQPGWGGASSTTGPFPQRPPLAPHISTY